MRREDDKFVNITMHSAVLGVSLSGLYVDHKNRNPLDNRRENLRHVTHRENDCNNNRRKKYPYPGLAWDGQRQKWAVRFQIGGKGAFAGRFSDPHDAYLAYCKATGMEPCL